MLVQMSWTFSFWDKSKLQNDPCLTLREKCVIQKSFKTALYDLRDWLIRQILRCIDLKFELLVGPDFNVTM